MSAWICDPEHFDVLVKAALVGGEKPNSSSGYRRPLSWWQVNDDGTYAGWRRLDECAETSDSDEYISPSMLGEMLLRENVRSVHHRYPDTNPDAGDMPGPVDAYYIGHYVYRDPGFRPTPGQVFKAIDCLDYQSCEHEGWRMSEAYAFLAALRDAYCRQVDGYDAAPWGFNSKWVDQVTA